MIIFRHIALTLALILLVSCKLSVTVPEGGKVTTTSGSYNCTPEVPCEIEVKDFTFDETFIAEPAEGYDFVAWDTRQDAVCSGVSKSCRLFTTGLEDFSAVADLLNSDKTYVLVPNFVRSSAKLRIYEHGDSISYKGTISIEDSAGTKSTEAITAIQEFEDSENSVDGNQLTLQTLTLRVNASGEEFPESSFFWQDNEGSWFDVTDTSGNFLVNTESNEFSIINLRSPLTTGTQETVPIHVVDNSDTSVVKMRAVMTTEVVSKKNITVTMGKFKAYKVKTYIELELPPGSFVAGAVVEQVQWVVPYIGPIVKKETQHNYDAQGNLIETLKSYMEATRVNF